MSEDLLKIDNLTVDYFHHGQTTRAVRNVSLNLQKGETLALVGESGCGKSTLALAVIGLLPKTESRIVNGQIFFGGENLLSYSEEALRSVRGKEIATVFQDPFSSLNPVLTIDYQLQEVIVLETGKADRNKAVDLLRQVQLSEPERILMSYPHQISGGQRQRVMIACALARNPQLLIADEPTTALDVTVQDEIIKLIKELQSQYHMAMIFVTHNLGLVKDVAQRVAVMKEGEIVEVGETARVLTDPRHPYTRSLLDSVLTLPKSK